MTSDVPPSGPPADPSVPPPPPPGSPPPPGDAGARPIPFEDPAIPFLTGFADTIRLVVTRPREAFERVPANGEIVRPLIYAVLIGTVCAFVSWMWEMLLGNLALNFMPSSDADMDMESLAILQFTQSIAFVFFAPIMITVALFIWSAIAHLFLMLVGGANQGFLGTFKTLCYVETASLAALIPMCGDFINLIWSVVLAIIGLAVVHRTTQGKSALAVLLPFGLLCACGTILFLVFGAAMLSSG